AGVDSARNGDAPPPFVCTAITAGGQALRLAGQSSVTRSSDDGAVRLLTVLRDVTREEGARTERESLLQHLRALAARLVAVREEERASLSRELHDGLGQALTGMRMDLALLRTSLPEQRTDLEETISALIQSSDEAVEVVRDLSGRLRPPILDVMGLGPALEWQVEEYQRKAPQRLHVDVARCPADLPKAPAVALFRIAQEALTNVLRHSEAADAWVTVDAGEGGVILEVRDNGTGVTPAEAGSPSALGFIGMRERARALGGTLSVDNHRDGGTRIRVQVPLGETPASEKRA
ncbi:MAG TPA: sensor histidine kinase, partial [Longimicrobiales bacterium]|nr:sensor histidine kinase [Longimicrobiales bacterium]